MLTGILSAMNQLEYPTVYPVHPRNRERAERICREKKFDNILLAEPVGYLTSVYLTNHTEKIVTDSGGLQREAFFAQKKCVTVLDFPVWPETMVDGRNEICSANEKAILEALSHPQRINSSVQPFGDGHAADRIVAALSQVN